MSDVVSQTPKDGAPLKSGQHKEQYTLNPATLAKTSQARMIGHSADSTKAIR
jgi:hypothetical protein